MIGRPKPSFCRKIEAGPLWGQAWKVKGGAELFLEKMALLGRSGIHDACMRLQLEIDAV
jgi:hypothetical protein